MFRHPNYYKNLRKLARNRDPHVRPISGSEDSATGAYGLEGSNMAPWGSSLTGYKL